MDLLSLFNCIVVLVKLQSVTLSAFVKRFLKMATIQLQFDSLNVNEPNITNYLERFDFFLSGSPSK